MRKFMALAAGAALLGGTMVTATTSAEARPGYRHYHGGYGGGYRHYGYGGGYRRRGNAGAAVAAGLAGALIGGAIAAQQRPHYYGYGYRRPYGYYQPYGYYRPQPTYYYGY